ncbi:hypothetical protein JTB14_037887 [Gonioctena quinquepunctata]|nr:hypothetical protein JTB14_037887 [Gonioctena quinquepunctata]
MINIFALGLLILITNNAVHAAPTHNNSKTLLDALNDKCSWNAVNETFKILGSPQDCPGWTELSNVNNLTKNNEKSVLCLLFYDSFVSFCVQAKKLALTTASINMTSINEYTPQKVCEQLFVADKPSEHNLSLIITPRVCEKLCTDYSAPIVRECSLAYYLAHFNFNLSSSDPEASKEETKKNAKAENPTNPSNLLSQATSNEHPDAELENSPNPSSEVSQATSNEQPVAHPENPTKPSNGQPELHNGQSPPKSIVDVEPTPGELTITNTSANKTSEVSQGTSSEQSKIPKKQPPPKVEESENPKLPSKPSIPEPLANADGTKDDSNKQHQEVQQNTVGDSNSPPLPQMNNNSPHISVDEKKVPVTGGNQQNPEAPLEDGNGVVSTKEVNQETDKEFEESEDEMEGEPPEETEPIKGEPPEETEPIIKAEPPEESGPITVLEDPKGARKSNTLESSATDENMEELDGGSYFFSYFMVICVMFVLGYLGYHNRIKVMALVLEGKRNKRSYRERRPNSANYHKLDSNLEEAITSSCTKNTNNIIY